MRNRSLLPRIPRTFALSFVAALALLLTVACGGDGDATPTGATGTTAQTPAADTSTPADTGAGMTPVTGATMPAGSATNLGVVGVCFEANTDASMIEDLRAGQTAAAEEVYTTCLEDVLPPSIVAELEPVIQQAAACGTTAAQGLSDDDVAAIEAGDRAAVEQVSAETLTCLSDQLGIPLS